MRFLCLAIAFSLVFILLPPFTQADIVDDCIGIGACADHGGAPGGGFECLECILCGLRPYACVQSEATCDAITGMLLGMCEAGFFCANAECSLFGDFQCIELPLCTAVDICQGVLVGCGGGGDCQGTDCCVGNDCCVGPDCCQGTDCCVGPDCDCDPGSGDWCCEGPDCCIGDECDQCQGPGESYCGPLDMCCQDYDLCLPDDHGLPACCPQERVYTDGQCDDDRTFCNIDAHCEGIGDEICDTGICEDGITFCSTNQDCLGIGNGNCLDNDPLCCPAGRVMCGHQCCDTGDACFFNQDDEIFECRPSGGGVCGDRIIQCPNDLDVCETCDDGPSCPNGDGCETDRDCTAGTCEIRSGDGCSEQCQLELCGDGIVGYSDPDQDDVFTLEECDDANNDNTDTCIIDPIGLPNGRPIMCMNAFCGDGYLCSHPDCAVSPGLEQCDDGNNADNDGCSSTCEIEGPANEPPESFITFPTHLGTYTLATWSNSIEFFADDPEDVIAEVFISIMRNDDLHWDQSQVNWVATQTWNPTGTDHENPSSFLFNQQGYFTIQSQAFDGDLYEITPDLVIAGIDDTGPSVAFNNPQDGGTVGVSPFPYDIAVTDPLFPPIDGWSVGASELAYQMLFDDGNGFVVVQSWTEIEINPPEQQTNVRVDAPLLPNGVNKIQIRATDALGNVGSPEEDTLILDSSYPWATITEPVAGDAPYTLNEWDALTDPVRGEAGDSGNSVIAVDVAIHNSQGWYWDGISDWQEGEIWHPAATVPPLPANSLTWNYPDPGRWNPPGSDTYTIKARVQDDDDQEMTAQITVEFDQHLPQGWFTAPVDQPWTNTPEILVGWDGSDIGTGIESFVINVQEDSGPWAHFITTPNPGNALYLDAQHMKTYTFELIVTDHVGLQNNPFAYASTTIDLAAPECTPDPLPLYSGLPLDIYWEAEEPQGESGVATVDVEISTGETWEPIATYCTDEGGHYECASLDEGGTYLFRCRATDAATNVGDWSDPVETTIDSLPPDGSIGDFPNPPWTNFVPFAVSWTFTDGGSGIDYYTVEYKEAADAGWSSITTTGDPQLPPWLDHIRFGVGVNGDPTTEEILEGETYQFRGTATDFAQRTGPAVPTIKETIIDTVAPGVTGLLARDEQGVAITNDNYFEADHITIEATAQDVNPGNGVYSGLETYTIWVQRTEEGVFLESYDCTFTHGEQGSVSCQTPLIPVGNVVELIYWVEVIDVAGNRYVTPAQTLTNHPLANFVTHSVILETGSTTLIEVQARNLNPETLHYVEINLTGYTLAGFVDGSGDFEDFAISQTEGSEGRNIAFDNFQGGGRALFMIEVIAGDPNDPQQLNLNAFARNEDSTLTVSDMDTAFISVVFPAAFSGLTDWAVVLLLAIAVVVVYLLSRRTTTKRRKR